MNDEKLIELVRQYPVLYDLSNPKYMDTEFKNTIWSQIGAEIGITGTLCKTRWGNIRDNFRKSVKKNKTVSGQKAKTVKQYKYSQQLNFLTQFFEERETRTNIADEVANQDVTGGDDICESVSPENKENTQEDGIVVDNVNVGSQSRDSFNPKQTDFSKCPTPRKQRKRSLANAAYRKTAAATVMEYLVKKNESTGHSSTSVQHPVNAFLSGIAPALKTLPPRYWHFAKADIFAAVQKYEYKVLMEQQVVVEPPPVSTISSPMDSGQPSPAGCYQQCSSTCSTSSYLQQHSPAGNYHQSAGNEDVTISTDPSEQGTVNYSLQHYFQNYSSP